MKVNISHLESAVFSLKEALDKPEDSFIRDSIVKRFEYTFELSWKTLKKYFRWDQSKIINNTKDIFREAAKQGLIESSELWFSYLEARNETSHTYSEYRSQQVCKLAREQFYPSVVKLVSKLKGLLA